MMMYEHALAFQYGRPAVPIFCASSCLNDIQILFSALVPHTVKPSLPVYLYLYLFDPGPSAIAQ